MERIEKEAFLAHATLPTFKRKVEKAKEVVREALAIAPAYVAVSWGKDSVVMLHLVQSICPNILAIHLKNNVQQLIHDYEFIINSYLNLCPYTVYQEIEVCVGERVPVSISNLKLWQSIPLSFIGLRFEENPNKRGRSIKKYGYIHEYSTGTRKGSYRCLPLSYWTWMDVWAYTTFYDLPYLKDYDLMPKDRGRTCNVLPTSFNQKGASTGRIGELRKNSPEAYELMVSINPLLQLLT